MADFRKASKLTERHESGYANHPSDEGGETWNGIARRYHPAWGGWGILDNQADKYNVSPKIKGVLNQLEHEFYKSQFWNPIGGDSIEDQDIANILYDIGVNFGTGRASKYLQRSLNLFNRRGKDYADIAVDGKIGANTLRTLNYFLSRRSKYVIIDAVATFAKYHWLEKAESKETQEDFVNGIFARWEANAINLIRNNLKVNNEN